MVLGISLFTSCSSQQADAPAQEGLYNVGTYTGTGKGINGDVLLDVTFSADAITDIAVKEHNETKGISDPAFKKIPTAIIENQSLQIDTVSGCTISSNAILEAVADAVTQAGGNADELKAKEVAVKGPGEDIERTADVIIIGGGGAGIAAATSAAENGASVILVEKTAALGGNTLASGMAMNAADPEIQSKMDTLPGQIDSLKAVLAYDENGFGEYAETLVTLKGQINDYLAGDTSKMYDSVEWHIIQSYLGGKRTDNGGNTVLNNFNLISTVCRESLNTYKWLGETVGAKLSSTITAPVGSMWMRGHGFESKPQVFEAVTSYIESKGAEIMLETKAEKLIMDGDKVIGVEAVKTDGTKVTLTATKGVIITTGGFGSNPEMVQEYNTYWPAIPDGIKTTCVSSATGDGIGLGLQANASLVDMGMIQLMPTAGAESGALTDGLLVAPQNYVFVNKEGKRFVNEYAERDVLASAALSQTDGLFFTIADQEMAKTVQNRATQEDIDKMVANGVIYKADTIEGLAEQIGCSPDVLEATINSYNKCVDQGKDEEFGKNVFDMKIQTAPFYACPSRPSVHHTMGGLEINEVAQVVDQSSGKVIPGLFAAGEVTGGIHGGNRLGGNAIADCFVFGKIAGQTAASN
ncbi:MAG TPA: flavocytochrome c [Clostridiales bacterium]|nr:flavocytochrome c [Clostridiales bacterium]